MKLLTILKFCAVCLILNIVLSSCGSSEKIMRQTSRHKTTDLQKMNLSGPVKLITAHYYKAKTDANDSVSKGRMLGKRIYRFDKQGNKTAETFYNPDGTKDLEYTYQYDAGGNLIEEEKKQIGKEYHEHFTYAYQENGRLKSRHTLYPDTAKTIYSYKDNGPKMILKSYDRDGKFYFKQEQRYKNDLLIDEKTYSVINTGQENELILTTHNAYRYDQNGNQIEEREFASSGKVNSVATYTYNDNGNVLKKTHQDGEKEVQVLFKNHYNYGDGQNWVQKIEYAKKSPQVITERTIEYY